MDFTAAVMFKMKKNDPVVFFSLKKSNYSTARGHYSTSKTGHYSTAVVNLLYTRITTFVTSHLDNV